MGSGEYTCASVLLPAGPSLTHLFHLFYHSQRQGHDTVEGERIQHLFGQGLPRVVNAILNRTRYDHGLHVAQNCLLSLAQLLPNVLQRWPDVSGDRSTVLMSVLSDDKNVC